jgi:UDP-N-acetylmuramate dehydrogenase
MKWVKGMTIDYREEIRKLIKGRVLFNIPMKRFTSMKVGGPVDVILFPRNVDELKKVVRHARKKSIPVMILGKGTNMIVRDKGIRGWVINLTQGLKKIRAEGEVVEAEAGTPLQRLVQFSVQKGLTGFEPFYGIPGTVGGGLAMNAGAWGSELKDILLSVTLMKENANIVERPRSRLRFSYRGLVLPSKWIILKGRFQLKKGKKGEMVERIKSYSEQRREKQPLDYPSAGSIFKNPAGGRAGRWIEDVGLKGYRIGQAMVSERHANFIINLGNASATDVIQLMYLVEKKVSEEKGVTLEREVKVVGE